MQLSRRAEAIQESPIRKLAPLANAARARGVRIYNLNIGQPDVPTPPEFLKAVTAFSEPVLAYGPSDGLPELRQAMVEYFRRYEIALEPRDILIANGGSEAILFAFNVVADQGQEIIIPEPFYTNYNGYAEMANLKVVPVRTRAEDGFHLPPDAALEKAVTPRTRAMLICSPNNPTGTVLAWEELERLAAFVKRHDLFLIADEVYKEFTYGGARHRSVLELAGIEDRVIVVDSISKRFSACGARVGAVISRNREVMAATLKFGQARLCPPTLEQLGAVAAYQLPESYFDAVRAEYQRRREVMFEALTTDPDIVLRKPAGAFYMIVKMAGVADSDDFARFLLEDFHLDGETVMVAPAGGFYATPGAGTDEVRMAYVLETPKIARAMQVFLAGLERYRTAGSRS
ncbi:MAG: pyridoxal phosphate-dependent aminotransferase [Thermoanaerobaculaceae bacterium]|nr:pyridoxal phosphate-dependent aminotransferase [Thermoanaerobaculaceae bacterium]MDI9623065.1 pyridoxal phosphate-dependent aminotransferase [Acidobacteriota bacterium]NLH10554.1 pyridoxal phosphate-dependent aminotransferase [Holophagae bacterium]HPW55380.1 pyridoxal phosphate-dependent aminotransferase [Thermoanaerobaculaceae bacterium]